jgi:RNA methyltransferase, TrmH family
MFQMLSKSHSKYIQSLHHKKLRDAAGEFIAEGSKVVPELLQSGKFTCSSMVATQNWLQQNEAFIRQYYAGPLHEAQEYELDKISALSTPGQVLAVFKKSPPPVINTRHCITMLLDDIQDPGNLGTIIRIADWFAVPNIVCSPATADMYNPKVVQSTMGSLARVNVLYSNLQQWLQQNRVANIYAAALNGKPVQQFRGITEAVLMIGNESKGIHPSLMALATEKITIPGNGQAESLNAAVAAGIIVSQFLL